MSSSPSVTVVVPAYNPGKFLRQALDSVRRQTYPHYRVVVVDDGSIEPLQIRSDDPVYLIVQPHLGISVARNRGMLAAESEFIAFLDADDLWQPQKLEEQIAFMQHDRKLALTYTMYSRINEQGDLTGDGVFEEELSYERLLQGSFIQTSTVIIRSQITAEVGLFDPLLPVGEDYEYFLRIALKHRIAGLRRTLTAYREHSSNTTKRTDVLAAHAEALRRHLYHLQTNGETTCPERIEECRNALKKLSAVKAIADARTALRTGDVITFARALASSAVASPRTFAGSILAWAHKRLGLA